MKLSGSLSLPLSDMIGREVSPQEKRRREDDVRILAPPWKCRRRDRNKGAMEEETSRFDR